MGKSIIIPNGILSICDTDFKCPKCECPHSESDYFNRLHNSKNGLIYKKCKGFKTQLGITSDIKGDIQVWLKEEEEENN